MAKEIALEIFQGTDVTIEFTVLNDAETAAVDVSSWALSWMLKKSKSHLDADAKITKTTVSGITVAGTFNSDPTINTQVVRVAILDTNTETLASGSYFHELKRTNADNEAILSYGAFTLTKAVHKA